MKTEMDNTMKNMIIGWGMPDFLKERYEGVVLNLMMKELKIQIKRATIYGLVM